MVATDAGLTKAECQRLAMAAQDGLARAVRPAHGTSDGDTFFALATGTVELLVDDAGPAYGSRTGRPARLNAVLAAAADTVSRAIVHALLAATTVGDLSVVPASCSLRASGSPPALGRLISARHRPDETERDEGKPPGGRSEADRA